MYILNYMLIMFNYKCYYDIIDLLYIYIKFILIFYDINIDFIIIGIK